MFERAKNRVCAVAATALVAAALVACGGDRVPEAPGQSTPGSASVESMESALESSEATATSMPSMSPAGPGLSNLTGNWTLYTIEMTDGGTIPIPEQAGATLQIVGSNVAIDTGCNTGSAEVGVAEAAAVLGPVMITLKACTVPELATLESAMLEILNGQPTLGVVDGKLTVDGPAGTLVYERG